MDYQFSVSPFWSHWNDNYNLLHLICKNHSKKRFCRNVHEQMRCYCQPRKNGFSGLNCQCCLSYLMGKLSSKKICLGGMWTRSRNNQNDELYPLAIFYFLFMPLFWLIAYKLRPGIVKVADSFSCSSRIHFDNVMAYLCAIKGQTHKKLTSIWFLQ